MTRLTGTLISYTRIFATRPGFTNPLIIGLLYCNQTEQYLQAELVDTAFERLAIGAAVTSVLPSAPDDCSKAAMQHGLKWKVDPS